MKSFISSQNSVLSLLALICFSANSYGAIDLKESFYSALKNDQTENISQARIDQKLAIKKQLQGEYLPSISAKGTYQKQDNIDRQTSVGLNLSHSLYKGGRDYYSVQSANANLEIAENQKVVERIGLYLDVVEAYYNYYLNLNDFKNLELLKKQSRDRTEEIRKRVQIGRSRRGEVMQAEAQLASVEAQTLNGQGLVNESGEKFYLLTGLSRELKMEPKVEELSFNNVKSLDEYLTMALAREDVKNKQLEINRSENDLKYAKGSHLPTLDLVSNYYLDKEGGTATYRKTDWDVGVTLTFPLFEGGTTQSKVKEVVEKKQEAIYAYSDYQKSVRMNVTSRYENFKRLLDQLQAYDQAMIKAKNSYDETLKDYRLGLVSNLDVLTSLNLYLDSKRNAEKTKISAAMNLKMLEASAGVLP